MANEKFIYKYFVIIACICETVSVEEMGNRENRKGVLCVKLKVTTYFGNSDKVIYYNV